MIISQGIHTALAIAADKVIPQQGDDETVVPAILSPVVALLQPHSIKLQVTVSEWTTSFFTSFTKNRAASTGASNDVLGTLSRGLWTISYSINAKFQSSVSTGAPPAIALRVNMNNDTQDIHAAFRMANALHQANGTFRILVKDRTDLILNVAATGAGDAIDCQVCLQGEKNI